MTWEILCRKLQAKTTRAGQSPRVLGQRVERHLQTSAVECWHGFSAVQSKAQTNLWANSRAMMKPSDINMFSPKETCFFQHLQHLVFHLRCPHGRFRRTKNAENSDKWTSSWERSSPRNETTPGSRSKLWAVRSWALEHVHIIHHSSDSSHLTSFKLSVQVWVACLQVFR